MTASAAPAAATRLDDRLWSVRMPLERSPLGYSLAYLLEHDHGLLTVDAGYRSRSCWTALTDALDAIGHRVGSITGVVLTHNHPDHVGLAQRIREVSGAWIALHPLDAPRPGGFAEAIAVQLRLAGVPDHDAETMIAASRRHAGASDTLVATRNLSQGTTIGDGDVRLAVLGTPGHTAGHVSLYDAERSVLIGGDLLLPGGEAQMSVITEPADDPVGDYVASLHRVEELAVGRVLPGHGDVLTSPRSQATAVRTQLERQLNATAAVLDGSAEVTAWELAQRLPATQPWGELSTLARRSLTFKTHALLRGLAARGRALVSAGPPERYRAAG